MKLGRLPHTVTPSGAPPAFLAGWLAGRRGRKAGISIAMLLFAVLSLVSSCGMLVFGVPTGMSRAREVKSLPLATAQTLGETAPGSDLLVAAQVPRNAEVGPYGLVLHRLEQRRATASSAAPTATQSPSWQTVAQGVRQHKLWLTDGSSITVQITDRTTFLKGTQVEENAVDGQYSYRYTGYPPGQALTVEGTWQGNGFLYAQALYAGTPQEYRDYVGRQPGNALLGGAVCGGLGLVLLIVAGVLRLLGK